MANVPYVGCGLGASTIAMDKVFAKQVAEANDIAVAKYEYLMRDEIARRPGEFLKKIDDSLKFPLFVKPAHLGSSIGISRVTNRQELQNALEVATHYDHKILVEEEVSNLIEVTLPIMGNDQLTPGLLERPLTTAEDFFDFDTKYLRGGKKGGAKIGGKQGGVKGAQGYSEIPAKLPEDLYKLAEQTGLKVYKALDCSGVARVDMLIDGNMKKVYFNEVNPLPGSLYAHNWRARGISSVDLVQSLIRFALERHAQKQQITTAFSTSFLQQF
jgi:D-alanine-D-alanine ligase